MLITIDTKIYKERNLRFCRIRLVILFIGIAVYSIWNPKKVLKNVDLFDFTLRKINKAIAVDRLFNSE